MYSILVVVVALCLSSLTGKFARAQTNDSDKIFVEAVNAVKNKDYVVKNIPKYSLTKGVNEKKYRLIFL